MLKKENNTLKIIFYAAVLGLWALGPFKKSPPAFAQNPPEVLPLTLGKAVDMALQASEALKIESNTVEKRRSETQEGKAFLFPRISGGIDWSNNFAYPDIASTSATQDYHLDAGISVSQTLMTFGRLSNEIKAARKALEASEFDRQTKTQEIIYNTKIAFYNAYLAQRTLEIAEESYQNAVQNKEILEERAAGGRAAKYDNIKIASDIASRKPLVNNARADFLSALETLKVFIGVGAKTQINLQADIDTMYPDVERKDLAWALYQNQPAIKALQKNIEEKQAVIQSRRGSLFPQISAFATWNYKGDGEDYYVGQSHLDHYGVAGLKVDVPIWQGGISREKLYQAKLDQHNAELKFQAGKEDYLLMLDKAINRYKEYKKTLKANEEALRLAKESFQYSQELFGAGQISVADLNDAELQLTNAKINQEVTILNLNTTLAVIQRLTLGGGAR
jgi:outer membrane protein TolC